MNIEFTRESPHRREMGLSSSAVIEGVMHLHEDGFRVYDGVGHMLDFCCRQPGELLDTDKVEYEREFSTDAIVMYEPKTVGEFQAACEELSHQAQSRSEEWGNYHAESNLM